MFIKCHYILSTIVGDLEKLIFDVLLFDVLFGGYFMSLFLSRVFYFIWQYSVDLGFFFFIVLFFGFMFLGLRIFLIGDKTFEKIFLVVYLLGISYALLWIIILSIFSTVVQKELDRYIQTVTYRVENYRIQKMKEKDDTITYYLLKTDKETKVIDKDSLQITEEDRFTNKKHKAGRVMTYTRKEIKGNVPKYKQKVLEDKLKEYNESYNKPEYRSIFKIITYKSEKVD